MAGPYSWFWALLQVFGFTVTADGLDIGEVNPFDVDWRASRFTFRGRD